LLAWSALENAALTDIAKLAELALELAIASGQWSCFHCGIEGKRRLPVN
jgi:hypothetical protein